MGSVFPPAIAIHPHKDLTGQVIKSQGRSYINYGGLSDIYEGEWTNSETGEKIIVAIKILRGVYERGSKDWDILTRRLNRESWVWDTLVHTNVLPFFGISNDVGDIGASPGLISPLCENGDILHFLAKRPDVDRLEMALGVASGLQYLHSRGVVHGDLKGSNVLVGDKGIPLLCDFGRSRIIGQRGFTSHVLGTIAYQAPELISAMKDDETDQEDAADELLLDTEIYNDKLTKKSDIYAYAMVALEVLTTKSPYYYIKNHYNKMMRIATGEQPQRNKYDSDLMTDARWDLFAECWSFEQGDRPEVDLVIYRLA